MKITVENETYFPTLGILAQAGDAVEIPDGDAFALPVSTGSVASRKKSDPAPTVASNESVVNDGSAPQ